MKVKDFFQKRKIISLFLFVIFLYLSITFLIYIIFNLLLIPNPYIKYREGYPPFRTHYSGSAFIVNGVGCYNGNNYRIGFYIDLTDIDKPYCNDVPAEDCVSKRHCYGLKFKKEYKNHIKFYDTITEKDVDFYTNSIITSCLGISKGISGCFTPPNPKF